MKALAALGIAGVIVYTIGALVEVVGMQIAERKREYATRLDRYVRITIMPIEVVLAEPYITLE